MDRRVSASVDVRPAQASDLDALVALEEAAFASDRAERRAIRHAIASPTISLLVALDGPVLIGAATLERRRNSRRARLSSIAVAPSRAGTGLGRLLLDAAEAEARRHGCETLRLEVREDNGAGIRLYERAGYARFETVPDYYEDGTTAWRYEKRLAPREAAASRG
ncbi:GNAT family N-acetyltransferase [Methylobacterium isbiliense]|uniref:Mycothiol acetyltransferase n=1 Tax=Methylobacterium isbiliense TaxID=315478 RepID=A0ABQ4SG20_9HYPH|nr:GNAT family N-acetyltransferase [Methylobacterium isbiliense]MDN3624290.1 GNAT family N-acetyltransferase [Methylobacterium isbiliense]GJE01435.1 Mycothiol acetyltransferase [Methylobacterium isbiliense]